MTEKLRNFGQRLKGRMDAPVHPAPLAVFRVLFGAVMLFSMFRLYAKGWVKSLYIQPDFHFSYYGFEWLPVPGPIGMYLLVGLVALSAVGIMLGLFYRASAVLFFLSFTYLELLDKAYYLNHYYFISIVAFLMILLPAHRYFSLDVVRRPEWKTDRIPVWALWTIRLQLGLVYCFAGIAKLEYDWLIRAQPLKTWLPAHGHLPLVGPLLEKTWVAYGFSWFGALYDLSVPFFLIFRKTRIWAYGAVVAFHLATAFLFPIGVFPYIMILLTLVFFPASFHEKMTRRLSPGGKRERMGENFPRMFLPRKLLFGILAVHFMLQVLIPWRFLFYPGELFWNEEGYRFSWRVMLTEKAGKAFFYIEDPQTGGKEEVAPSEYLTPFQEKMMVTQPDMILQFAHHLEKRYQARGIEDPVVTVDSYVTLNGSGSRRFIDPGTDLSQERAGFHHKEWVIPFRESEDHFLLRVER